MMSNDKDGYEKSHKNIKRIVAHHIDIPVEYDIRGIKKREGMSMKFEENESILQLAKRIAVHKADESDINEFVARVYVSPIDEKILIKTISHYTDVSEDEWKKLIDNIAKPN